MSAIRGIDFDDDEEMRLRRATQKFAPLKSAFVSGSLTPHTYNIHHTLGANSAHPFPFLMLEQESGAFYTARSSLVNWKIVQVPASDR